MSLHGELEGCLTNIFARKHQHLPWFVENFIPYCCFDCVLAPPLRTFPCADLSTMFSQYCGEWCESLPYRLLFVPQSFSPLLGNARTKLLWSVSCQLFLSILESPFVESPWCVKSGELVWECLWILCEKCYLFVGREVRGRWSAAKSTLFDLLRVKLSGRSVWKVYPNVTPFLQGKEVEIVSQYPPKNRHDFLVILKSFMRKARLWKILNLSDGRKLWRSFEELGVVIWIRDLT